MEFPALVITILILPGILFSYMFRKGLGPSPIVLGSIQSEVVRGILFSIPINLLAIGLINWSPFPDVDYGVVITLLTGWQGDSDAEITENIQAISNYAPLILIYVLLTSALSALTGYLLHLYVRYYRLDLRFEFLRMPSEWYYLLSGKEWVMNTLIEEKAAKHIEQPGKVKRWQVSSAEIKAKEREIDFQIVAVALEQGGDVYIYRGILDQYFFDKKGALEKIVMRYPQRRKIKQSRLDIKMDGGANDKGFYQIDGHYFVIEYNRIMNLNLYYYSIADAFDEAEEESTG